MKLSFGAPPPRRRPSLTPMIDVVFLLLVFFMLASRFGSDMFLPLKVAGQGRGYTGAPRLLEVAPDTMALNGVAVAPEDLVARIGALTDSPEDTIVLRARDGADLQRVIGAMELLRAGGFSHFVLVE
ncbi:biopolymer transporter ExbD [Tropicimonas sp. IMCC34043]|uniref:ExbD/TolR family protein n=1 Tax=Tropicimonas sp. IMCC34043 TaxID=2248760 RepID=UPI000E21EC05|nr:biopolymer transporter ExbD [Tropicimonas sp. IMCC34043]